MFRTFRSFSGVFRNYLVLHISLIAVSRFLPKRIESFVVCMRNTHDKTYFIPGIRGKVKQVFDETNLF